MPRWPGGLIRKTPVTPAGPLQNGAAPGVWTLADAAYWTKQGLWPTAGNFLAVEDVFSTYVYTGTSSANTITNGINLSGQGGLVWTKSRSGAFDHILADTVRGGNNVLYSNSTVGNQAYSSTIYNAFSSTGYTLGTATEVNNSSYTYASWTFRKAPKFFDVVTYTGTGSATTIAHNLGVAPGCIIVKRTNTSGNWAVYHRGNTSAAYYEKLNLTDAQTSDSTVWNSTDPTSSVFSVGTSALTNASGSTYVAYLFAHDPTADGIIQCGSYVRTGSSVSVNLGWEPQWVLVKKATDINGFGGSNWAIADNMRGFDVTSWSRLNPNTASAETTGVSGLSPNATGFTVTNASGQADSGETYIYIAIRRGPMKTPTSGTSVFSPSLGVSTAPTVPTGFVTDFGFITAKTGGGPQVNSRLTGTTYLTTVSTAAEAADANSKFDYMNGWYASALSSTFIGWSFRRAPGFFDVVCYTGTGAARTVNHNLGVAPEMVIIKNRSSAGYSWITWTTALNLSATYGLLALNSTAGVPAFASGNLNGTAPTSTLLSVSGDSNASGNNYVAYLFASCPGVSKIGSYTGNGSSQTINCGFSNGARFFLVKRTDSTGDWWVWDSARGITAPADPALRLNSTAAEVTSADATDPDNSGIIVNQETTCNINVNGATYIFLAIA